MYFLKYVWLLSMLVIIILFTTINLSTPPKLSKQIDLRTLSAIKLNTYVDNYSSDNEPWWGSSYWWK